MTATGTRSVTSTATVCGQLRPTRTDSTAGSREIRSAIAGQVDRGQRAAGGDRGGVQHSPHRHHRGPGDLHVLHVGQPEVEEQDAPGQAEPDEQQQRA